MKLSNIAALFIAILIISDSCYDHEEGCRDTNALNYNVMADEDCQDNCCKYPKVSLKFGMYIDTIAIDTNRYFSNFKGDSLRIRLLRIYLSNFSFTENSGEIHPVNNSVTLGYGIDSLAEYKKVLYTSVKVNEKGGNFDIGSLDKLSVYSRMDFVFGIDSSINHAITDRITTSSYLHQFSDSMHINRVDGFYFLKLVVDIKDKTERSIFISGDKNLRHFSLEANIDFQERENHIIPVKLDLDKWLSNIDFLNKSDIEITDILINNLNSSLQISDE